MDVAHFLPQHLPQVPAGQSVDVFLYPSLEHFAPVDAKGTRAALPGDYQVTGRRAARPGDSWQGLGTLVVL